MTDSAMVGEIIREIATDRRRFREESLSWNAYGFCLNIIASVQEKYEEVTPPTPGDRDRREYQIMVAGKPVKIADATREQLENALMRALDVVQRVEDQSRDMVCVLSNFIEGRDRIVDAEIAKSEKD